MRLPKTPYKKLTEQVEAIDYSDDEGKGEARSLLKGLAAAGGVLILLVGIALLLNALGVFSFGSSSKDFQKEIEEITKRSEEGVNDPAPNTTQPANVGTQEWNIYPITGPDVPENLKALGSNVKLNPYDADTCEDISAELSDAVHEVLTFQGDPLWVQGFIPTDSDQINNCPSSFSVGTEGTYLVSSGSTDILYVVTIQKGNVQASNLLDVANNKMDFLQETVIYPMEDPSTNPIFEAWGPGVVHYDYQNIQPSSTLIEAASTATGVVLVQADGSDEENTAAFQEILAKRMDIPVEDIRLRVHLVSEMDPSDDLWFTKHLADLETK